MKKNLLILLLTEIFFLSQCLANEYAPVYNEAWKIVGDSFYDSTMNNQNWNYWKRYADRVNTREDLKVAVDSMLTSLDDKYTRYLLKTSFNDENNDIHENNTKSISTEPRYFRTRIPQDIKYIRIDSMMNKNLAEEIKIFITEAEKAPDLKGYIIDLRDNGGGLVKNASDTASLFMNDKVVLYAKTNSKEIKNTTSHDGCITDKPVVILINGYTASACEVFTGAMQDNKRAYVIGTASFGKGVIQQIKKLPDGSGLHVTVMAYYTPDFKEINNKGITPDEEVYFRKRDIIFHKDVQLLRSIKWLKSRYDI